MARGSRLIVSVQLPCRATDLFRHERSLHIAPSEAMGGVLWSMSTKKVFCAFQWPVAVPCTEGGPDSRWPLPHGPCHIQASEWPAREALVRATKVITVWYPTVSLCLPRAGMSKFSESPMQRVFLVWSLSIPFVARLPEFWASEHLFPAEGICRHRFVSMYQRSESRCSAAPESVSVVSAWQRPGVAQWLFSSGVVARPPFRLKTLHCSGRSV